MLTLKEIQQRNYNATVRRGLISDNTTIYEFFKKLEEEKNEFFFAESADEPEELADVIIVCLCYAKHYNIDIQKALEEKTLYNEKRKD